MNRDRYDVLERFAPLFEAPEPSFERFLRRRERKLRNRRIAAGVVAMAVFAVPIALFAAGLLSRNPTDRPAGQPDGAVIDQPFADSINECERLLVTKEQVASALGFSPDDPSPLHVAGTSNSRMKVERLGGAPFGCEYYSLEDGRSGGDLVITAYTADAPPNPVDRGRPVPPFSDEAVFSHLGNGDQHLPGPEGATSMLEVRRSDLILRFNAGVYEAGSPHSVGAALAVLRRLAGDALASFTPIQPEVPAVQAVDYVIDIDTGEMTPLPGSIIRTSGAGDYAVSPDGSQLAYSGSGRPGTGQIFVAGLDGTGVRQVTDHPEGAAWPAWSPDGTKIAYEGIGNRHRHIFAPAALFVLDVATGESTQIVQSTQIVSFEGGGPTFPLSPQFTPDGSSLIYTDGIDRHAEVRSVPVAGGKSELLIGAGGGSTGAWDGSLSPDGALLTFLDGQPYSGLGPRRWVASADGTERRLLPDVYGIPCVSNPAGTWSPDGSRIVCSEASMVVVIDIATGDASPVARGRDAIWLDDHTLLVSV